MITVQQAGSVAHSILAILTSVQQAKLRKRNHVVLNSLADYAYHITVRGKFVASNGVCYI